MSDFHAIWFEIHIYCSALLLLCSSDEVTHEQYLNLFALQAELHLVLHKNNLRIILGFKDKINLKCIEAQQKVRYPSKEKCTSKREVCLNHDQSKMLEYSRIQYEPKHVSFSWNSIFQPILHVSSHWYRPWL